MAGWVFCNRCFQPPHRASRFSLTNCGHVYCDVCLRKGGKDECLICKVPCRTLLLSKHTDVDIQALFMGIDGLCKKYSRETSQVSEFQEKHRRRLLAFYREKIARLEESLQKSVLRMEQLQRWVLSTSSRGAPDRAACLAICLRPCDQGSRRKSTFICQKLPSKQKCSRSMRLSQEPVLGAMKTPVSTPSAKPAGHLLLRLESSASDRVESMQVDRTPSPTRKGPPWSTLKRSVDPSSRQECRAAVSWVQGTPRPLAAVPACPSCARLLPVTSGGHWAHLLLPRAPTCRC
uniref:probable E3 SUMO-protein ligase RNF212 isoform X3 n=1 Tax=Nyctereutes procyonoides TaxID=34880 RepID=UPI002444EA98|nr:probable E3 SUMO-protein ligase RNF212 isoform X3 [Nyctereutes procyonoides]